MCNLCHETISMCLNGAENMRQQQYLVERDIQKYMAEYEVRQWINIRLEGGLFIGHRRRAVHIA